MTMRNTDRLLARLARVNRTTLFLITLGVALAALFLPGIAGAVLLLALAGLAAVLLVRTWTVLPVPARVLRLVVLAVLVFLAVTKV